QAGFNVLTMDDPVEALGESREGLRPDVIVSDVSMPQLDGFAFYEKVREIPDLTSVPFLCLTPREDRRYKRTARTLAASDCRSKPVQKDELLEAVTVRHRRVEELRRPLEGVVSARGFGPPMVTRQGERLDWDSLKALELLFYLLEHRSGVATFE